MPMFIVKKRCRKNLISQKMIELVRFYTKKHYRLKFISTLKAPIIAIANEGYVFNIKVPENPYKGNHGFVNTLESIRTIFLAHGPSFNTKIVLPKFRNINVYSLICDLIEIQPLPSNGTIDPFKKALVKYNESSSSSVISKEYLSIYFLIFFITCSFI
jgi:hypothetical protein